MWDAIKGMFTGSISGLVEKTGEAIDRLVTSDAERLALRNELVKIKQDESQKAREHIAKMESQITERHANDMKSDSWLSKNVRPMALIFLTVSTVALAYITSFTESTNSILSEWIDLFKVLLVSVYVFYFGSRGYEKVSISKAQK